MPRRQRAAWQSCPLPANPDIIGETGWAMPNYHVWTNANKSSAINSRHWLFMAQPEPFPETLMSAVPAEWFLKNRSSTQAPKVVFDEYIRCYTKKTQVAMSAARGSTGSSKR